MEDTTNTQQQSPDQPLANEKSRAETEMEKHKLIIECLLDASPAQAKAYDKKYNIGYFSKCTKSMLWLDKFVTVHPDMMALKEQVIKLADPTIIDPVLIIGDTGTGKELLAHALHGDRTGNFVEINCAGMPETLIESELFGYEKGAFTGAKPGGEEGLIEQAGKDKQGNAARGTLFLDEIGELNINVQAKLLRVLNDKRVRRVGGKGYTTVDFRLVCATHCPIDKYDKDKFREDLYYRISTFELKTIPLSQRREDILPIVRVLAPELFPITASSVTQNPHLPFVASLKSLELKGNVRELQNRIRRYQILRQ